MHKIKAKICQMLFPNADAIVPKRPPNSSIVFGASVAPVKVPTAYFKIHPITTVYPIAIAREPRTGIIPNPSPTFLFPFFSQTIPNASIGPDLAARPKLISPITPVDAITTTKIKYGIKKEPPIQRYPCRKHPYISHANCRTNAGEDKSPPAVK